MSNTVSLVKASDSEQGIRNSLVQALDLIDFRSEVKVNSVSIKPNLCYYWSASTGYTTDPRLVAAIIDWIRGEYGYDTHIRIVEADATAMRTKYAFRILGYEKLAKEKDVELFNLSNDNLEEKRVHVNHREIKFQIPQSLFKTDLFINAPKLKVGRRAIPFTCALKNIFGCIGTPRKIIYHPFLSEAIVGVNKILHPHLTVVDGIVALGRVPVRLGLLMAGADPFSIDWVASQIMGNNPSRTGFMKLATLEKLGDPHGLSVVGEDLKSFKRLFPHINGFSAKLWKLQLKLLKAYQNITGDVIPPILEEEH